MAAIRTTPATDRVRYKTEVRFHDKNEAITTLLRACGAFRELGDLVTILAGLPPKMAARIQNTNGGRPKAAPAWVDHTPHEWPSRLRANPALPFTLMGLTPDS